MTDLPSGWAAGPLSEFIQPRAEKVAPAKFPDLPFVGMDHVEPYTTRIIGSVPAGRMKSNASWFSKGDVLYGRLRPYLNKVAQPNFDGLASAEFIVFSGNEFLDASFLRHRLNARDFVSFASHLNEGDRPRVAFNQIGDFKVLVPPLREQHRIVEKIESLLDNIDRGVESLRAAKHSIACYRQSLLKSAFKGQLTADWRVENSDKVESANELLARIRKERETHYQSALHDWQEAVREWRQAGEVGRKPTKPKQSKRYPSSALGVRLGFSELPYGWIWSHLGVCSTGPEYGTAAKSSTQGKVSVVRMGNVQNGRIDWNNLVYTSDEEEIAQYSLLPGDVLFNRTNSPELVGKSAMYRGERPAIFAGYLVRVNQIDQIASGAYVAYFLNSPRAREYGRSVKTDGVNQSNINGTKLQEYPFPVCSPSEQAEIVRLLDTRFEAAEILDADINSALARADALRQSILKQAFAGRLVPQSAKDEPATVLLARTRTQSVQPPVRRRKKRVPS